MNRDKWKELRGQFPEFEITHYAECGDGWYTILQDTFRDLSDYGFSGTVVQVKEKFGALRIYFEYGSTPEDAHELCNKRCTLAETLSESTCEYCGDGTAKRRTIGGWLSTLCDVCNEKAATK